MYSVKNRELINLYLDKGRNECISFLNKKCETGCNPRSIEQSFCKLLNEYRVINKSKARQSYQQKLDIFLDEHYHFPAPKTIVRKSEEKKLCESLGDKYVTEVALSLASNLKHSLVENKELLVKNEVIEQKLHNKKVRVSNINNIVSENKSLLKRLAHLNGLLLTKNASVKRARAAETYCKTQYAKLKLQNEQLASDNADLKEELENVREMADGLRQECHETHVSNEYLQLLLNTNDVILFDDDAKVYNKEAQECVYALLSQNVTTSKVSSCIKVVLKVANLKANRLPSLSTVNNMNIQRLILAQKQLSDILPKKENLCLLSDETSKYGKKIEGFHTRDESGQLYVLGLRQMVTKSGHDTFSTFQEVLSDIENVSTSSNNPVSKKILLNIVSTMSDRAATQKKFNALLEEYRQLIIVEDLGQVWFDMSPAEQLSLSKLNNFFCALHALVHMAETANSCLQVVEEACFDNGPPILDTSFRNGKESGTTRLLKTASKAFSCGGDEKCGVYGPFNVFVKDFLKANKLHSIPIQRFRGNRFNILFSNAANVFFMLNKITEYLSGDSSNRLLKSIKHDISIPEYKAGLKALGLVAYLVTVPLWTFIEDRQVHIMDSPRYYSEIISFLRESVDRLQEFVEGKLTLSFANEHVLYSDPIFLALTRPWEHDAIVITTLSTLLPGLCESVTRLFSDYIDGGEWSDITPTKRHLTISVPKNNKFSETVFGHVDRILREKPNITIVAQEAYVMFCHNKTLDWIHIKSDKEKNQLLSEARHDVCKTRMLFRSRRIEIEERRKLLLRQKFEEAELKEKKKVRKLENYTNDIIHWGLWQTAQQVEDHLKLCLTKKNKIAALKAQLHFRKDVLHQRPTIDSLKYVYLVTKVVGNKRVPLDVEELSQNVQRLIENSLQLRVNDSEEGQTQSA